MQHKSRARRVDANTARVRDLSRLKLSDVIFWILAGMSAAALVVLLLVVAGVIPIDAASEPESSPAGLRAADGDDAPDHAGGRTRDQSDRPRREPSNRGAVVVLAAVRGDCWFSASVGSENGRVLDERVLAQGETVRLRGERIWLSVGAAGNVEVTVDGKPKELAPGTVSVVLAAV